MVQKRSSAISLQREGRGHGALCGMFNNAFPYVRIQKSAATDEESFRRMRFLQDTQVNPFARQKVAEERWKCFPE